MSNFLLTGLFTEGTTDIRFLESVVKTTLENVAFDCSGDIETELQIIKIEKAGLSFNEQVLKAAQKSKNDFGVLILFVHTDSDNTDDLDAFRNRIIPAKEFVNQQDENEVCKKIVAIVPVQMTESWMLADKELLKHEIGIEMSDFDLGIHKQPEEIANPKAVIENIIRISKESQVKKKRKNGMVIADLYQIIGQKTEISKLEELGSYIKFKNSLIDQLRELNFYHK
ncbi:DUF4276 family protein [Flavobacterium marginilacus]|uniref:DUF4276 family protein n=1 Tax=Flavobacterium marginilacus TaxID=3003256 RepID=UPI00248DF0DA|nr:DUF4276 family protein [Flavobacterium marginilacus]